MNVLLVDDEPMVRAVVAELLELDGHMVAQAESGQAALAFLARDRRVDLVLADVAMPRMNGWALAREIKARYPTMRIGLITGYGETGPRDPLERSVVDFVLTKPLSEETLRTIGPVDG
jgi:CheY-like chemotaxis protein